MKSQVACMNKSLHFIRFSSFLLTGKCIKKEKKMVTQRMCVVLCGIDAVCLYVNVNNCVCLLSL